MPFSDSPVLPLFMSHHSIGKSILTIDETDKKDPTYIKDNSPVSIFSIAKKHQLSGVVMVETDISSYWKAFKAAKTAEVQLVYCIKLWVCNDLNTVFEDKEKDKTESEIIIVLKNTQAYYDFVKLYTKASTQGLKNEKRRIDYKSLQEMWTENFKLLIPFYTSFLAQNLMIFNSVCMPEFGKIKPTFCLEEHGMPFDAMLQKAVKTYCKDNKYPILNSHTIKYYKDSDAMSYLTLKLITKSGMKATWDKPNLEFFSSDKFSFESFLGKVVV